MVRLLEDKDEKRRVVRKILEALPDWFGIEESREQYIRESADQIMIVAEDEDIPAKDGEPGSKAVGFLCLKQTGNATVELAVMGVLAEYHRKGIGRELFKEAKRIAQEKGYSFMQVKTVEMGHYDDYDATNRFYISLGFQEFEMFPLLWDEANPCQIYVMSLK
jgi:GNAT superfamily N-acetyltransferase